jgi:hypothetical protein
MRDRVIIRGFDGRRFTPAELSQAAATVVLRGTGNDPYGRFPLDAVVELPAGDPAADETVAKGWAVIVTPAAMPRTDRWQVANQRIRQEQ